jgi:hypothetical protein
MPKGERQGREAKKPKKDKNKSNVALTPLQIMRTPPTVSVPSGKKK